ncbi:type II toxin-antitoxin system VapC family toxin [Sphingobium naphthae]|uniref:type II toxin-antitoxin system VapC family toxin n=1 Tax=Sphingobium naphthae TaxID=1886786 RepID=UPI000AC5E9E0
MADKVLDSSTLIAFILGEPHGVDEDDILADASISSVNLSEVIATLVLKGTPEELAIETAGDFGLKVLPFDAKAAAIAGTLIAKAQPLNIGFGDCACIATGMARGATIYTADRDWLKLGSDADIRLIR